MTEFTDSKMYEIQQQDETGAVLSSRSVSAMSGDSAARQIDELTNGAHRIVVCLDGLPVTEMGVDYWQQRMRRR